MHILGTREDCETSARFGQVMITTCSATGVEGIWSGSESGTLTAWEAEHRHAHDKQMNERCHAENMRNRYSNARHIYRTTEPGDPRRRGIGAYL